MIICLVIFDNLPKPLMLLVEGNEEEVPNATAHYESNALSVI